MKNTYLRTIVGFNVRVALEDTYLPSGGGKDGLEPVGILKNTQIGSSIPVMQSFFIVLTYGEQHIQCTLFSAVSISWVWTQVSFVQNDGNLGNLENGNTCRSITVHGCVSDETFPSSSFVIHCVVFSKNLIIYPLMMMRKEIQL